MNTQQKLVLAALAGIAAAFSACGGPGAQTPADVMDADGGTSQAKDPQTKDAPMREPSGGGEKASCGGHER